MRTLYDLAIVGGGSVGISFLSQFLDAYDHLSDAPRRILLFEPDPRPGPGAAYQKDARTDLLNIPAENMSARHDDRGHFVAWLHKQPNTLLQHYGIDTIDPKAFLPRALFGAYLRDIYNETLAFARNRQIEVTHVVSRVDRLAMADDGHVMLSVAAGDYSAAYVVLCNGNLASCAFPQLENKPGYFNSPYPVQNLLQTLSRDANIGVVGTSLSAVDAIAALAANGHRGRITAMSRNGRLPAVRSPHNVPPASLQHVSRQALTTLAQASNGRLTLDQVETALLNELASLDPDVDLADITGAQGTAREQLDSEVARSLAGSRPWQALAAATNPSIDLIWHLLPAMEKRHFHQTLRSLWMARRATFPMRNALTLQSLMHSSQLDVRGGFSDCAFDETDQTFKVTFGADGEIAGNRPEASSFDHLINATSFSVDVARADDPLVRNLIEAGYAQADPFGGFALDFNTGCLRAADNTVMHRISVLGSLACGTYFWTLSMDVNARLAQAQAARIAAAICEASAIASD